MRPIACIVGLAALLSLANAQLTLNGKTYSLSPSKLIAEGADNLVWSPDGSDLAFSTKDKIGVYSLEQNETQSLISLDPKETVDQVTWLEKGHEALAFTRKPNPSDPDKKEILTIRILDSRQMTCRSLYEAEVAKGTDADAEVISSPLFAFALVQFTGAKSRYLVLTQKGSRLIDSPDIDQAVKEGKEFAAWSDSGTALFGPVVSIGQDLETFKGTLNLVQERAGATQGQTFAINLVDAKLALESKEGFSIRLVMRPRGHVDPGQAVLECVPSNGALRSVRFNGEYQAPPEEPAKLQLFDQDESLHLGQTIVKVKSLWLIQVPKQVKADVATNRPVEARKQPQSAGGGLLISPEAEEWWYAPHERAVAYRDHGSVFVRSITVSK